MNAPFPPAGSVPDGADSGQALRVASAAPDQLVLSWGASCLGGDTDYAIYAGPLAGSFDDHGPVRCSTDGATTVSIDAPAESSYFLVVAHNDEAEGSYGVDSAGNERWSSDEACLPQRIAACE
jgi:hypothetical protein